MKEKLLKKLSRVARAKETLHKASKLEPLPGPDDREANERMLNELFADYSDS
jgi:hypothetical protein